MHLSVFTLFTVLWSSNIPYSLAATVYYTLNIVNADVAPDGLSRPAALINGKVLGEPIFAFKGDLLKVTVYNNLDNPRMRRSTSLHWHGIYQKQAALQDGSAGITQCPISPGYGFTYSIDLTNQPPGTYWYHSHLSSQYVDGIRAPLIIYDYDDPHKGLYDVDDAEHIITLADWYHKPAPEVQEIYLASNNTAAREMVPDSGLINGVGRYNGGPEIPRASIRVVPGLRYRLRIINMAAISQFRFSIQGHKLTVIEADGISCVPYVVDHIDISAAQRYSVVISATEAVDNYWIRAPIVNVAANQNPNLDARNIFAVLRYRGADEVAEPTTSPGSATGDLLREYQLVPLVNPAAPGRPCAGCVDKVFNLTFDVTSAGATANNGLRWLIDNKTFHSPSVPTLLQILSGANNDGDFGDLDNTRVIRRGQTVEINLSGPSIHPFHLHGHPFSIVRHSGQVNYDTPTRRDTVTTGAGVTTIRFIADNPGPWVLHCHVEWHFEGGLAVVFAEDPEGQRELFKPDNAFSALCPIYNALDPALQ